MGYVPQINKEKMPSTIFIGELSLDGKINRTKTEKILTKIIFIEIPRFMRILATTTAKWLLNSHIVPTYFLLLLHALTYSSNNRYHT